MWYNLPVFEDLLCFEYKIIYTFVITAAVPAPIHQQIRQQQIIIQNIDHPIDDPTFDNKLFINVFVAGSVFVTVDLISEDEDGILYII